MPRLKCFLILLLFSVVVASTASAQRRVTGRVTDQTSGQPVPGAAIQIQGTALGTTAADDGTFAIQAPDGPVALIARRIGYQRREIPLPAAQTQADVALRRDVLQLETQVTTGAATSVAKRNTANDVVVVTGDAFSRVSAPSLENALAGRIAGATVSQNSGAPGGGNQIRLRGVTSVFGSADPLYVVDGVIVSNETIQSGLNGITAANRATSNSTNQDNGVNRIADLNPNDIESLEVLKGASASAIYGSKAANGVIIIKTKQGSSAAGAYPSIDLVQRFGTRALSRKYGHRQFTLAEAEAYGAGAGMSQAAVDSNYAACAGFCDFEQQLFGEHPFNYETSVGLRGTVNQTSYYASGLNSYDGGIQKNTGYRKQSVRLNLTQLVRPKLTLSFNNNLVRTLTSRGVSNNDNANVTPYFVFATTPSWFDMRPTNGIYPKTPVAGANVFQDRDFIQTPEEVYRLISSASAAYAAFTNEGQSLTFRIDGGLDRFNQQDNIVSPRFLFFEPNDGLPGTVTSLSANVLRANANFSAVHEFTPAGRGWNATTSLGLQREISSQRSTNIITRDVLVGQENVNRGAATEVFADRQAVRGLAMYGQEEVLALSERLLATVGARAERSTLNGDINKFYFFPKASLSYRLPGLFGLFDEFKPRFAVGQSGNQPLYIQKYTPAQIGTYTGQISFQPGLIQGQPAHSAGARDRGRGRLRRIGLGSARLACIHSLSEEHQGPDPQRRARSFHRLERERTERWQHPEPRRRGCPRPHSGPDRSLQLGLAHYLRQKRRHCDGTSRRTSVLQSRARCERTEGRVRKRVRNWKAGGWKARDADHRHGFGWRNGTGSSKRRRRAELHDGVRQQLHVRQVPPHVIV